MNPLDSGGMGEEVQKLNPREELVALLRGQAACPILTGLGRHGFLDQMLHGPFSISDFTNVADPRLLSVTLTYLASLGLLRIVGSDPVRYEVTKVGHTTFTRYGSCALITSYREYFERVAGLIVGDHHHPVPTVDRRLNVIGSGQLHARKFFPHAYVILTNHPFRRLIDLGCGNGEFIDGLLRKRPEVQAVGVDISEVAASEVRERFGGLVPVVLSDAGAVAKWTAALPPGQTPEVISLWYVVHEFTAGRVDRAVEFFTKLHAEFPKADVIMGEIVNLPTEVLSAGHIESIMPEFLLFHALSGQGVLTWENHLQVLRQIPYTLEAELLFDELADGAGGTLCSSFVWHLRPKLA